MISPIHHVKLVHIVCKQSLVYIKNLTRLLRSLPRLLIQLYKVDGLHASLILQSINHLNERSIVNGNNNEKLGLNADNEIKMMMTSTNKQYKLR